MKQIKRTKPIILMAIFVILIAIFAISSFAESESYLTFTALEDNSSVTINYVTGTDIQYRKNQGEWTSCPTNTTISLNKNEYIQLKGKDFSTYKDASTIASFAMTGKIAASGDVTSLLNEVGGDVSLSGKNNVFQGMFVKCTSLVQSPKLPSTILSKACYQDMFNGCTSLVTAPNLPATTVAESCYKGMFYGCKALENIPTTLPATTLQNSCYYGMFRGCVKLTQAPTLPALTIAASCYQEMFKECTSLTTAPALPSPTTANSCYWGMFSGCTSLTTAPTLPATYIDGNCYREMFYRCTSLKIAPSLPATTLHLNCYMSMFEGCTSLQATPKLPAQTLGFNCYYTMFKDCTSLTNVQKISATTCSGQCCYCMFYGCTSLEIAPNLNATTLASRCYQGMFMNCTKLKVASNLPATTLTDNCYRQMYYGCSSLAVPPVISAITLAEDCFVDMFGSCKNLYVMEGEGQKAFFTHPDGDTAYASGMFSNTMNGAMGTPTKNSVYYFNLLINEPYGNTLTYNANDQELVTSGKIVYGSLTFTLGTSENNAPTTGYSETLPSMKNAGTYYVWFKFEASVDGMDTVLKCIPVTIFKKEVTIVSGITAKDKAYDGNDLVELNISQAVIEGTLDDELTFFALGRMNDAQIGENKVVNITIVSLSGNTANNYILSKDNHQATTTVTIGKGSAFISKLPTGKTFIYDGSYNDAIILGTAEFGTIYYAVNQKEDTIPLTDWSTDLPKLKDAGVYYVWYKVVGNENYNDVKPDKVVTTISAKELGIDWKNTSFVYDGDMHKPTAIPDLLFGSDVCEIIVIGDQTDAGTYTATAQSVTNANYALPKNNTHFFEITKATTTIDTKKIVKSYIYDGNEIEILTGASINHNETQPMYTNNKYTNVGKYSLTVSAKETANYLACVETVEISITPNAAVITVDQTPIEITYGQVVNIPVATSNFGKVICDKTRSDLLNAGEYVITFFVAETGNYTGDTKTVNVKVNKALAKTPTIIGNYVYNGSPISVSIDGLEGCMTTKDSLSQTEVGIYKITFQLDDNHEWEEGNDGIVTWEIKQAILQPSQGAKQNVTVTTPNGFDSNMTLDVNYVEGQNVKYQTFMVDYYNLSDREMRLSRRESVCFVFDIQMMQEGKSTSLQPSDLGENTTIKIKMQIPEEIDLSKITKIYHVHSETEMEVIAFDASKVDENGYYEIEVDKLSEFAFIYQEESPITLQRVLIVLAILVVCALITYVIIKKDRKKKSSLEYILG